MPFGLRIMQLGLEPINLTIPFYLIKILIGHSLYMVMSKKSFLMTCQIVRELDLAMCFPIFEW